jgi:hypothetical protein
MGSSSDLASSALYRFRPQRENPYRGFGDKQTPFLLQLYRQRLCCLGNAAAVVLTPV